MDDLTRRLLDILLISCASGKTTPQLLAGALGMHLLPGFIGYAEVDPVPEGFRQILLGLDDRGGPVRFVTVALTDEARVRIADVESVLTDRRDRPPMHPGDPERWAYDLAAVDGESRCTVVVDLRPGSPPHDPLVAAVTIVL